MQAALLSKVGLWGLQDTDPSGLQSLMLLQTVLHLTTDCYVVSGIMFNDCSTKLAGKLENTLPCKWRITNDTLFYASRFALQKRLVISSQPIDVTLYVLQMHTNIPDLFI